jgi:hypothetical protein
MLSVVGETISSSANGQLRPGDSLGIWTYNQKLSVELPVQEWDPDLRPRIAYRAVAYLKAHRYEKTSSFDKVLPDIMRVIGSSRNILVFIISNGELNMSGTPFDDEFNKTYRQNLKDMRGQKMPIVTILVGKDGKLDRYTINPLPWPIVIPELPAPPQPLPEKAVLPQPPAPVVPRKIGQPLILHGPDNPTPAAPIPAPAVVQVAAAPAPAPTPLPAPPAATPPAVNSATVTPPAVTPVIAAATTTEPAKNETPPIAPAPIAKTPAPTAGPAPTPPVSAATPPPAPKPVPTADQVKSSEPAPAAPAVKPAAPTETVSAGSGPATLKRFARPGFRPDCGCFGVGRFHGAPRPHDFRSQPDHQLHAQCEEVIALNHAAFPQWCFAPIIISGLKLRDLSSFILVPIATITGVDSPSPQGRGPG